MGDDQSPLALRVMRITTPQFKTSLRMLKLNLLEDMDAEFLSEALPSVHFADRVHSPDEWTSSPLSGMLSLPSAFGSVYLGQLFCLLISICNISDVAISHVDLKVDLASTRSSKTILESTAAVKPGQRLNFLARQEVKESGPHVLTASSNCAGLDGEIKFSSQVFRFTVAVPLVAKTKIRPHPSSMDHIVVEASLENTTRDPMFLERVAFTPTHPETCQVETIRGVPQASTPGPLGGYIDTLQLLSPNETSVTYKFRVQESPEFFGKKHWKDPLGRIDILWRNNTMGDLAHLQTQPLACPLHIIGITNSVRIKVVKKPDEMHLELPIELSVAVENFGDSPLFDTSISGPLFGGLHKPNIVIQGLQSLVVGDLYPGDCKTVVMKLLPLEAGPQILQSVSFSDNSGVLAELPAVELFVQY